MGVILIALIAYLAAGTLYARQRTAQGMPTTPRPEFRFVLDPDEHERGCDFRSSYRPGPCGCQLASEYRDATRTIREWERLQVTPTAREVYERLLFWPLLIHHSLMRPPVTKETRRDRRMRHELENARHIAAVTEITSGNQRAINDAMNPLEIAEADQ